MSRDCVIKFFSMPVVATPMFTRIKDLLDQKVAVEEILRKRPENEKTHADTTVDQHKTCITKCCKAYCENKWH